MLFSRSLDGTLYFNMILLLFIIVFVVFIVESAQNTHIFCLNRENMFKQLPVISGEFYICVTQSEYFPMFFFILSFFCFTKTFENKFFVVLIR